MKRVFVLIIIICAFASVSASNALAQSGRAKRAEPPKEERAEKSETKDETKDEAQGEAKGEAKNKQRDEAREDKEAAGEDKKALTAKEATVRAVIKSKPNPIYPREARRYGVQGQVKLRIILGSDGRVSDEMEVLEGLPHGITDEAIKAARRIEFEPARKDGRPVSQYVTVIYHFSLH